MNSQVLEILLKLYENLQNFEQENDLGNLYTLFYEAKMNLYLTVKELMNASELNDLDKKAYLLQQKKYDDFLTNIKNDTAKIHFEQYLECGKKFKNKWNKG